MDVPDVKPYTGASGEIVGAAPESVEQIIRQAVKRIEQAHKLRVSFISVRYDDSARVCRVEVTGDAL